MNTRTAYDYEYLGCGFPVIIDRIEMMKFGPDDVPMIDFESVERHVLCHLAGQRSPLTGNQARFIRLHMEKTLEAFGALFGVTHAAVKKWESHGDEPAGMGWSTEKDLRLCALRAAKATKPQLASLYLKLTDGGRAAFDCPAEPIRITLTPEAPQRATAR